VVAPVIEYCLSLDRARNSGRLLPIEGANHCPIWLLALPDGTFDVRVPSI